MSLMTYWQLIQLQLQQNSIIDQCSWFFLSSLVVLFWRNAHFNYHEILSLCSSFCILNYAVVFRNVFGLFNALDLHALFSKCSSCDLKAMNDASSIWEGNFLYNLRRIWNNTLKIQSCLLGYLKPEFNTIITFSSFLMVTTWTCI